MTKELLRPVLGFVQVSLFSQKMLYKNFLKERKKGREKEKRERKKGKTKERKRTEKRKERSHVLKIGTL